MPEDAGSSNLATSLEGGEGVGLTNLQSPFDDGGSSGTSTAVPTAPPMGLDNEGGKDKSSGGFVERSSRRRRVSGSNGECGGSCGGRDGAPGGEGGLDVDKVNNR